MDTLGLEERLRHRPDQLSMGERQRVMIARALSTDPKLVLADEPTGSLDSRRGQEVLELLTGVCRERELAVVLVTHDPQAAAYADRVHTLRDGRLRQDDEPESRLVCLGRCRLGGRPASRRSLEAMRLSSILLLYRVRLRTRIVQELFAVRGIAVGVALLFASQIASTSLDGSVAAAHQGDRREHALSARRAQSRRASISGCWARCRACQGCARPSRCSKCTPT